MGIANTPCQHCFTFFYEDERVRCWGDAWELVYDGPLRLQKEEVSVDRYLCSFVHHLRH